MNQCDIRLIKSVAEKTGIGVTVVKNSLINFLCENIRPNSIQLTEYLRLRYDAVARFKVLEDGTKEPWTELDYINAAMKAPHKEKVKE